MAGRKNNSAVSDEEIIAALIQAGTIKDAAQAAGIGTRTIYDRMNDREFRAAYMNAKTDILRRAVLNMNSRLSAAVDAITDIMQDKEANPAVRLQAAQTILNNAAKYADTLAKAERDSMNESKSPLDILSGIV